MIYIGIFIIFIGYNFYIKFAYKFNYVNEILHFLIFTFLLSTSICFISDPGNIKEKSEDEIGKSVCPYCSSIIRIRSRHCKLVQCDKCVNCFHKHSYMLNKCIGWKNRRSYFFVIMSLFLIYGIYLLTSFYTLFTMEKFEYYTGQLFLLLILSVYNIY